MHSRPKYLASILVMFLLMGINISQATEFDANTPWSNDAIPGDNHGLADYFELVIQEHSEDGLVQLFVAHEGTEFEQWKLIVQASDGTFVNTTLDVSTGIITLFDSSVTLLSDGTESVAQINSPQQLAGMEIHSTGEILPPHSGWPPPRDLPPVIIQSDTGAFTLLAEFIERHEDDEIILSMGCAGAALNAAGAAVGGAVAAHGAGVALAAGMLSPPVAIATVAAASLTFAGSYISAVVACR